MGESKEKYALIFFLVCISPFGAGMPNAGKRVGFNLTYKKCATQNYKRGGGVQVGPKSDGWVSSKIPPPPLKTKAYSAPVSDTSTVWCTMRLRHPPRPLP